MQQQWIQFTLTGEHYIHPVSTIKEVLRYQAPLPVPGAPDQVEGILNIRGDVITVFSGHKVLDLPEPTDMEEDGRIVSFDTDNGRFGVSVDSVEGIVSLEKDDIEPNTHSTHSDLIQGTVHHQDDLLISIDFINVFERYTQQKS